jgi:DNA-directed RNA polymerase specialized sigma24 family protein
VEDETFKLLQQADWEAISIELAGYAVFRARNLGWRTGERVGPETRAKAGDLARDMDLAMGLNPIDVAQQAIKKVLDGSRIWDPNRGPLLPYLRGVVDSLISHLAESPDNQLQRRVPEGEEDDELWDRSEFRAPLNDSHDLGDLMGARPSNPEQSLLDREADDSRVSNMFETVKGNPKLEETMSAIMQVGPKPMDIAEHLGVAVSEVNNRLKRLRRLVLKPTETINDKRDEQE